MAVYRRNPYGVGKYGAGPYGYGEQFDPAALDIVLSPTGVYVAGPDGCWWDARLAFRAGARIPVTHLGLRHWVQTGAATLV